MYLNIKRGEYIILFAGEKNNELKQLVKDIGSNDINIVSKNAYIVSCLQSGTIIGNSFGKTTINIFEREKLIKKLRIIVLPRRKNKYPILVDRFNAVPRNFKPENLIRIDRGTPGWSSVKDIYICKETALAYNEMLKQAWKEDIFISVTHGYRSYEEQKELKKKFINQIGKQNAVKRVAPAGYSEHHTGWALDLAGMKKTDGTYITSNKEVYQWIEKNCYKYGFIIKNLKGKEDITGTIYEPWHIRYVGMSECSKVMSQKGLTLNEYLDMVNDNSLQCLYHGSNFDKVRDKYLTLKDICEICGVEISNVAMGDIDLNQIVEFSQIKMSKLKINRGDIFFCDQQVWEHISEKKADEIAINAFENGAKLLFSKRKIIDKNKTELPTIIVDNPLDCIIQIGKYIRNQYSVKTIGITGTCGKTTTKTLIYLALSSKFETHTNNANANDVNNVFDFITKLNETYEYYVQEVSGAGPGRVESSSEMLGLNASVVTNIGNYHLDLYKSIDNIAYDKLKIVENLAEDGIAILNFDDDILCNVKEKSSRKIIYISEFEEKADYYIKNSVQLTDGLVVNIIDNYTNIMPKEYSIKIDIIGRHNAFNIAAAFAIGQWAGIEEDVIIEGLQKYKSQGFRQVLKRIGDKQLYLDCFSLTEKSTITSIKTLVELPCDGKRIAVIGGRDILELN